MTQIPIPENTISNYSIWLTDPKSISFVCISSVLMLLIGVYYLTSYFLNKKKIKSKIIKKIFKTSYANYISLALAIIMGLIYGSFTNYANYYSGKSPDWVWQIISFQYAFGSWIVAFILFSLIFAIPFAALRSFRRIVATNSKNEIIKKLISISIISGLVLAISCLFFVIGLNNQDTSLWPFSLENNHDIFFRSVKTLYHEVFLTQWYAIVFTVWLLINFVVFFSIAWTEKKKNKMLIKSIKEYEATISNEFDKNPFETYLKFGETPFKFFDAFGSICLYMFFTAFMMFNIRELFTHIGVVFTMVVIVVLILSLLMFTKGIFKFKNKKTFTKEFLTITFNTLINKKHYFNDEEIKANYYKTSEHYFNVAHTIIIGTVFTVFLGFSNLTDFGNSNLIVGAPGYKDSFINSAQSLLFWLFIWISTILFTFLAAESKKQGSIIKNGIGSAAHAITPGLQTGSLSFMGSVLKRMCSVIDEQAKIVY